MPVDSLGRSHDNGSMRALPLCSKDFYIPGVSPAGFYSRLAVSS